MVEFFFVDVNFFKTRNIIYNFMNFFNLFQFFNISWTIENMKISESDAKSFCAKDSNVIFVLSALLKQKKAIGAVALIMFRSVNYRFVWFF